MSCYNRLILSILHHIERLLDFSALKVQTFFTSVVNVTSCNFNSTEQWAPWQQWHTFIFITVKMKLLWPSGILNQPRFNSECDCISATRLEIFAVFHAASCDLLLFKNSFTFLPIIKQTTQQSASQRLVQSLHCECTCE